MINSIFLIFIGLLLIVLVLYSKEREAFHTTSSERNLRADSTDLLTDLKINKIFVGEPTDTNIPDSNNLATNNTIFIKNSIEVGTNINNKVDLDINTLKQIKYLPYNFKNEMCLDNSCINKHHIKIIKGKRPFKLNTFTTAKPFRFYSEPNYGGWANGFDTQTRSDVSLDGNGIKSFKISDKNYMFTAYAEPNYGGTRKDYSGDGSSDVTGTFPNGFKSIQPRSSGGNLLKNYCFQDSEVIHAPDNYNQVIQAVPCDKSVDVYYINRQDLNNHTHSDEQPEDVDFHEHSSGEEYHYLR